MNRGSTLYLVQCRVNQVELSEGNSWVSRCLCFPKANTEVFTCPCLLSEPWTVSSSGTRKEAEADFTKLWICSQFSPSKSSIPPLWLSHSSCPRTLGCWFLTSSASLEVLEVSKGDQTPLWVQVMLLLQGAISGSH